jgi:hypothetical protein
MSIRIAVADKRAATRRSPNALRRRWARRGKEDIITAYQGRHGAGPTCGPYVPAQVGWSMTRQATMMARVCGVGLDVVARRR